MTEVHTCSYSCQRIECIRAQRDELVAKVEALRAEVETWKTYARGKDGLWRESVRHAERLAELAGLV